MAKNPSHTRRGKVRRHVKLVLRLLKSYERSSIAYNRDCNMRCPIKPGDTKNNKLMWKSRNAFERLMVELKRMLDLSARVKNKRGVRASRPKK